jgi:hypothetical protein
VFMYLKNYVEQSEQCELWFLKVIRGNLSLKIGAEMFSGHLQSNCVNLWKEE